MKKIIKIICVISLVFLMTGCVKYNGKMDIKNDRSMTFSIIYAIDTAYFGNKDALKDDELKYLEEHGFEIEGYSNGDYKGATLTKKYEDIDLVSTTEDVKYSLSKITASNGDEKEYLFKIEKGLFKNKYKAVFEFDPSDAKFNTDENPAEPNDIQEKVQYDIVDSEQQTTTQNSESMDSIGTFSSLDLNFNVSLPYPAIRSNATTTTNRDKNLKWVLTSDAVSTIEFEFEIYNLISVSILIGISLITILSMILLIIAIKRKKQKEGLEYQQNTMTQSYIQDPITGATYAIQPTDTVQYDPVTGTTYIIQGGQNPDDPNMNQ